ncbi:MAG: iron ABC transporter permease [Deltaproteobacteria bacterium]|nr:iron ABC transporter permease [Deltaproteobacteria bacterium]
MKIIKIVGLAISPIFAASFAIFIGAYEVNPVLIIKILLDRVFNFFEIGDIPEKNIIIDIRLPRVVLAGIVGGSLSCAGVCLQSIFRNPLVDPFILGISAGAAFGCAVTVGFLSFLPIQLMAFVFAMIAVGLAYGIAKTQEEVSRLALILSGVVISAFFSALVSIIKFLVDPHRLQAIVFWLMGSFSLSDWKAVKISFLAILIGVFPAFLMRWRLNVMSMGDEEARALGVNVKRERLLFIVFSTFATAISTSLCGIIGWVGLMVPHIVRMLLGPDHRVLLPLAVCLGASFMIVADTVSRTITNFDIPVGIVTALTGAPFFIYLMKIGRRETWGR